MDETIESGAPAPSQSWSSRIKWADYKLGSLGYLVYVLLTAFTKPGLKASLCNWVRVGLGIVCHFAIVFAFRDPSIGANYLVMRTFWMSVPMVPVIWIFRKWLRVS